MDLLGRADVATGTVKWLIRLKSPKTKLRRVYRIAELGFGARSAYSLW